MDPRNDSTSQPDLNPQVEQILAALKEKPTAYLVAITGIPGSGKSTLSAAIAERIPKTVVMPMDGYHWPRKQLSDQDMKRRGAPHTFDYQSLSEDLKSLRQNHEGLFPAFDHSAKDPQADAICVSSDAALVLVEGNYLLLNEWQLGSLFDFTVFVDSDLKVAMERVVDRLCECGICPTREEALQQMQSNDLLNAQLILADGAAERSDLCVYQS